MNGIANECEIDVRALPARNRHAAIFATWNSLAAGEALVLVNDHDPVPLYYQFACEHGGTFRWEYLEQGPETWRVRITKGRFADPGYVPAAKMAKPEPLPARAAAPVVLDVRPIFARGETPCEAIDAAVASVAPGQSLVLLVPFEPVPLYAKLRAQGFTSQTQQLDDGTWRLEFVRGLDSASPVRVACGCGHD